MPERDPRSVAERLFAAIEAGDVDAVAELYDPDVVVWHNTDGAEQRRDVNLRVLRWLVRTLPERRYTDRRLSTTDTGFVAQHVLRGATTDGREVAIPACIVATCRDGLVTRIEEYVDSAHVAHLTGERTSSPRRVP